MTSAINPGRARSGRRYASSSAAATIAAFPGLVLLGLFSVVPLALLVVRAMRSPDRAGFVVDAFRRVLDTPAHVELLGRSLGIALLVTVVSMAVSWPVAWTIAKHVRQARRSLVLSLVIVPFLTSQLLLIYAMLVLLGAGGPLMSALSTIGLTQAGQSILYTPSAIIVMFLYESVSVIVLIMYPAAETVDDDLVAASRSMGAGRIRTFMNVAWPTSATALLSAVSITFVATAGAFAEAAILGGPNGTMIGNVIADRIRTGGVRDPLTSALAVVLLVASLAAVGLLAVGIWRLGRPLRSLDRSMEGQQA